MSLAGCVPTASDGDTDTDTDSDTDGPTGSTMSPATSEPATSASGTMTSSTDPTMMTATTDSPTTDAPTTDASDTEDETETAVCPPGSEDCPCDVGSTCDGDLLCVEGTCLAELPCDQPEVEPNDAFDEAVDVGEVACSEDYVLVEGALSGTDQDFFSMLEGPGGVIPCFGPDPQAIVESDAELRVCMYLECDGDMVGTPTCAPAIGPGMEQEADELDGLNGCCGTDEARFYGYDCPGFMPPPPTFYARVINGEENVCIPYELSVRFN